MTKPKAKKVKHVGWLIHVIYTKYNNSVFKDVYYWAPSGTVEIAERIESIEFGDMWTYYRKKFSYKGWSATKLEILSYAVERVEL